MRKVVLLFVFALFCVSLAGVASAAPYPGYPAFSDNDGRLSLSGTSLSASDSIVYSTGYYSIGAGVWVPFMFTGTGYLGGSVWLENGATATLPAFPTSGEHYVVMFSCTKGATDWSCHDMKWQMLVVGEAVAPTCSDNKRNGDETGIDCGGSCPACPVIETDLMVGMAKVTINPPMGQPLGGYDQYDGCASIHDDLHARVLVLQEDGVSIALVALDLLMFSSDNVINRAKQDFGLDYVILSSSHTHAAPIPRQMMVWDDWDVNPDEEMDWDSFPNDPWYAQTENKVVAAIGEAMNGLFPATISAGTGTLNSDYMSVNRRCVSGNSVRMCWSASDGATSRGTDQTVGVVRINDASRTRAMIVNYACHPVHTSGWNDEVSADYPGVMSEYIENDLGPDSIALFINGAAGDVDPHGTGSDSFNSINRAGTDLAQTALNVQTQLANGNSIEVNSVNMELKDRWEPSRTQYAGLTTVVIHDSIAFVAAVGEFFTQHQINLRDASPIPNTFLYGYSYSGLGGHYLMYLPTREAAAQGGDNYGGSSVTYLQIGAGEAMIDHALNFINQAVS